MPIGIYIRKLPAYWLGKKRSEKDRLKMSISGERRWRMKINLPPSRKGTGRSKEEWREINRKYYTDNRERILERNRKYRISHPEVRKNYRDRKYNNDIQYHLSELLRSRLRMALKKQKKVISAVKDLGCSMGYFKEYIEKQFTKEMSWDKLLSGEIHIDHKKPLSKINLLDEKELSMAVHYTNLQPLWATDNLKKYNHI